MNKVKYLLTYRYSMIIQDLTLEFCKRYLSGFSKVPTRRTTEQMTQAARSGKQNIVEGVGQSQTSKKGEIKLLGVSLASFEELLADFEDFLRQGNLQIYPKIHPKVTTFRNLAFRLSNFNNLSSLGEFVEKPKLFGNPQDDANFFLTLCHQETYLLHRQIKAMRARFIKEGGFTENLFRERLKARR